MSHALSDKVSVATTDNRGLVIKNTGSWYLVQAPTGAVECKVKGNFRLRRIRSTNPVVVGDWVAIERNPEGTAFITAIEPRTNYIIRRSINLSKESHIIAANLDLAALVVTLSSPPTSLRFIDRFLATAEAYRVPVLLVFNKIDLYDEDDADYATAMMRLYEHIGYRCHPISATTGEGVEELRSHFSARVVLLSGHSGVGKSTLINALIPDAAQRTAAISECHGQGMHTTTFSEMLPLPSGGYLIDTPGIKGFGTLEMDGAEVAHYFPDLFHYAADCRFSDCTHRHEPGCAVLRALEEQHIALSRYESYVSILDDKEDSRYR